MYGHFPAITDPFDNRSDGTIAHGHSGVFDLGENPFSVAVQLLKLFQDFYS